MIEPDAGKNIHVISSHWNRHKIRDEGTGVTWNKELNKWEAKVIRNLGSFDSVIEAAAVIEKHLYGTEAHLLEEFLSNDDHMLMQPTAIYVDEEAFEVGKQVSRIERRKLQRDRNGED